MSDIASTIIQVLLANPLTVSLVILGVICVMISIIGTIPPIRVGGYRALFLGSFGALLIIGAVGLAWLIATQTLAQTAPVGSFQEQNGLLVMEAEHFTERKEGAGEASNTEWKLVQNISGYSGEAALQALPDKSINPENYANGPALLYRVNFKTPGLYYVYVRGLAPDNQLQNGDDPTANNSLNVGINGKSATIERGLGLTGFDSSGFTWQGLVDDAPVSILIPQPGTYTFYVWMREDGFIVDKIILSTNINVINNGDRGSGPDESPRKS